MKICGIEIPKTTRTAGARPFPLVLNVGGEDREFILNLSPLPWGRGTEIDEIFPENPAPTTAVLDKNGKPLVQDGIMVREERKGDAAWQSRETQRAGHLLDARCVELLLTDSDFSLSADPKRYPKKADYYEAAARELKECGFTERDRLRLLEAFAELGGISSRLKDFQSPFLERKEGNEPSSTSDFGLPSDAQDCAETSSEEENSTP